MPNLPAIDLFLPGPAEATRVVVAMSGGVDSSVVAGLLKGAGYDVVGITLQLYDHGAATHRKGACCAGQDIHDARRVAEHLGIPHYVLDYEQRFRRDVIDSFAASYAGGETPVPCVTCNQTVKFRDLLTVARDLGAAALATGHYVETRAGPDGIELYQAADPERDQSYFLYGTTREQLAFLRFPLGGLEKSEVRRIAGELKLPVAEKADSQDICFVPSGRYSDIVARLQPEAGEPGDIVDLSGRVLGRHKGILHFTIGQRRGLGIASGEPLFVVGLDRSLRRVVVGPREALRVDRIRLRETNWLGAGPLGDLAGDGLEIAVRIRSTGQPRPARLRMEAGEAVVEIAGGEEGVSPGQACVFYAHAGGRARVLGGGTIAKTVSRADSEPAFKRRAAAGR
ncbi:MAG: tRNA 2-thiouridine(34) synthase MnmA [Hyphomicrobiaceae bacterium]